MIDSVTDTAGAGPDLKKARRQMAAQNKPTIDRLPPHSLECELGVLGCQLLSPNDCIPVVIEKLGDVAVEAFYDLRHQTIQKMLIEMFIGNEQIDVITLQQRLKDKQLLDQVGGISYLASLPDAVPSAANLSYYLDFVLEKYVLRKIIHTCTDVVGRVYNYQGEVEQLVDEVERDILRIRIARSGEQEFKTSKELVPQAITQIEGMWERNGRIEGISTGLCDLDKLTGGLHESEMTVIAGFPGAGKTSLAMNIAENVLLESKKSVAVFSLEMSSVSLVTRFICSHARVNLRNIRDGFLAERDFPKLTVAAGKISNAAMWFSDRSDVSIFELRAMARRLWQQHSIGLVVIDYIQLLNASGGGRKLENRQQEVADISAGIKNMAREFRVPIIALSQLNDDGRLRESRAIGQDADNVYRLECEEKKDGDEEFKDAMPVTLRILKQRNGPTGKVNLTFLKCFTRFESAAKIADEDVPSSEQFPT